MSCGQTMSCRVADAHAPAAAMRTRALSWPSSCATLTTRPWRAPLRWNSGLPASTPTCKLKPSMPDAFHPTGEANKR